MELRPITHIVTKTILIVVFWLIFLIDIILEPQITFKEIGFALVKAIVICGAFWVLFVLLVDTFLKTMIVDAKEKKADRIEGGISYHITEPSEQELVWFKEHEKEIDAAKEKEREEAKRKKK